jgi:hypothetical protein
MGQVIEVDNHGGGTHPLLTETGTGGLFSAGYLRDRPAESYLEDDETPVFLLANGKRGVEIDREDGTEQLTAGSGYRTIAVLTDRRLVILVGDSDAASVDGDQCLTVRLVDVDGVDAETGRREGRLSVTRTSGGTLTLYAGADGLDAAAAYLTASSQAWIHVENTLDDVQRSLVAATGHFDAGEYDAALEAAQEAYHGLNEPRRAANRFDGEWTAAALTARVDQVQRRCASMLAEARLGRARRFSDDAESHWRDDEFEAAHDAFDDAREELETVLTYDSAAVSDRDAVHEEHDRIERVTAELSAAPLRRAVEADRAATDADDPADAADHWDDALEAYCTVLELDWGADERRFEGDPDQLRDRLGEVVERLVSARRTAASKAKRAGDWYVGAEQYEVAVEEFEVAREQYDLALAVARERYAGATDHLTVEREAVESRLERATALRDGEDVGPVEMPDGDADADGTFVVEATIGDEDAVGDGQADGDSSATGETATDSDAAADDEEMTDSEATTDGEAQTDGEAATDGSGDVASADPSRKGTVGRSER